MLRPDRPEARHESKITVIAGIFKRIKQTSQLLIFDKPAFP